jgi:hypothetical protein
MNTCKAKQLQRIIPKIHPELNDREKTQLFNHYQNRELNQFFLIIIKKVLSKKKFTCDDHSIIIGLLIKYSEFDFSEINMTSMEDILRFVGFQYRRLIIIDIEKICTYGF